MKSNAHHEPPWLPKARAISQWADLCWRSSRDAIEHVDQCDVSVASPERSWIAAYWPRNKFEQSMFVSIAAMLAKDVVHDDDPVAEANERFPLVPHIHVSAMSDDDLRDWCADDVERMIAAGDRADREHLERLFIAWCEGLLGEMLAHIAAE